MRDEFMRQGQATGLGGRRRRTRGRASGGQVTSLRDHTRGGTLENATEPEIFGSHWGSDKKVGFSNFKDHLKEVKSLPFLKWL